MFEGIAIVGAGVVGLSIAYELSKSHQDIYLFEKSPFVGDGQSTRNSGVLHSGIYYPKGTLKSELCISGNRLLYEFCKEHNIPCENSEKLIVATNPDEDKKLESLLALATNNGIEGVALVSSKQATELEQNVQATSALYLNTTGIIDAGEYVNTLARLAAQNGAEILKSTEVTGVDARKNGFTIKTDVRGEIDVKYVINAAGLYSDDVARMINPMQRYQIAPVRGEYFSFNPKKEGMGIQRNIYPAPKPNTVGIHLTPTMDPEKVIVGPTAINISSKIDFSKNRQPVEYFLDAVKSFFSNIKEENLRQDFSGIRAKLKDHYDFVIKTDEKYPKCLHLIGIDSPGLTSSQAIAKRIKIKENTILFN